MVVPCCVRYPQPQHKARSNTCREQWTAHRKKIKRYLVVLSCSPPCRAWWEAGFICENVPTWCCLNVILESCKNIATTLRVSCENVGTWSCCNIFQESFKSVAAMLAQNIVRKHLHNMMATFIDNVEVLWCSQCCANLSAIWENPRRNIRTCRRNKFDGVKSDAHTISLADFMFHLR